MKFACLFRRGFTVFRMAWALGSCPAEFHELFFRKPETGKVEEGILKHSAVAGGEDKPVTVDPVRFFMVMIQDFPVQHCSGISEPQCHTGMPGCRSFHCVCHENTDGFCSKVQSFLIEFHFILT